MASPLEAKPGHYDHGGTVEITPQEEAIGKETHRLFQSRLKRHRPWYIQHGVIDSRPYSSNESRIAHTNGLPHPESPSSKIITLDDIAKEQLSPEFVIVGDIFKMTEDHLPDFMGTATGMFRHDWGLSHSYNQWAPEEEQHSELWALIFQAVGAKTNEEIEADYYRRLKQVWKPPFDTPRKMLLYAAFQEKMTFKFYSWLAENAKKEGAPLIAEALKLPARDESYHGGGYIQFANIYAKYDPEGIAKDAVEVATNFDMPAEGFVESKIQAYRAMKALGFDRLKLAEDTFLPVIHSLDFVPKEAGRAAVAKYAGDKNLGRKKVFVPQMPGKSNGTN